MIQDLLQLEVVEPSVYTEVRTLSYRVRVKAQLMGQPIEGRFGQLDEHIFVCQHTAWGSIDFLRLVEARDYGLPAGDAPVGQPYRTNELDIYVASPVTAQELVAELLGDTEGLLAGHTDSAITVVRE